MYANKTINNLQKHIESLMKVSAPYGKKMGTMGTSPFNSAAGSAFSRRTAEMMAQKPGNAGLMLDRIFKKATDAGVSSEHMKRMDQVGGRIFGELGSAQKGRGTAGPLKLRWL